MFNFIELQGGMNSREVDWWALGRPSYPYFRDFVVLYEEPIQCGSWTNDCYAVILF